MGHVAGAAAHAAVHAREHRQFAARVAALRADPGALTHEELGAFVDYLKDWLVNHIMKTDCALAALLQSAERR